MNLKSLIDGSVQAQGLRITTSDWLDMGSVGWRDTPDKIKGVAYQIAKKNGWTDAGLLAFILSEYHPRIDKVTAELTLDSLRDLAQSYPLVIENVPLQDPSQQGLKPCQRNASS